MHLRQRLAGALAALALLPLAARSNCKIETAELPITMVGTRAIATVRINGTPVPMLVDSGAFYSFLTEAAAAQLKLETYGHLAIKGTGGIMDSRMAVVKKLQLLGGDVPDVDFVVGGNDPGGGAMGIIGRNILSVADTEYDLAHGAIRLVFPSEDCESANMAYWAGDQPVSEVDLLRDPQDHLRRPAILGIVEVNDKKLRALFDSGAYATVMTLNAAHRLGLADRDMTPSGASHGVDGKVQKSFTAPFAKIDIGGELITNNRLRVADLQIDQDMLLGMDFFLSHRIYVSRKRRVMFLTYNGGRIFTDNTTAPATAAASAASSPEDAALDADGYARRGAASASRGDLAGALADLDRACALAPASAGFLVQRAEILQQLNEPQKARADIDQALQIDPRQVGARLQRAAARARAKDSAGALADLAELDRQLAPEAQPRADMGRLYLTLHEPALALAEFDRWIPHHAHEFEIGSIRYDRCWARLQLGTDLDKAMDDCDAAVDANTKDATFLAGRGWVWLREGKPARARSDFDRSLAAQKDRAFSLYGRGLAEQRLGDAAAGQADLDAARRRSATIDADVQRLGLDKPPGPP